MKVVIDVRCLASSSLHRAQRYTSALIRHLTQRGIAVYLHDGASIVESVGSLRWSNTGSLPARGGVGLLREQMHLPRLLRRGNYDLLHIPTDDTMASWFSPCPVVMTVLPPVREQLPAKTAVLARVRRRVSSRSLDHIIATSEYCRQLLVSELGVQQDRISVIPCAGIDSCESLGEPFGTHESLEQLGVRPPYLLNAGGYESEEDTELLLSAFGEVRQFQSGLQLVLTGAKMPSIRLLEHAHKLGLTFDEDVLFLFDVGEAMQQLLYDRAELAISVAANRVCQPWILQAMARGLQVVCTANGCAAEMVGCVGKIIPRPDPHDAALTTIFLLSSGNAAQRRSVARQQAARFSWEKMVDETIAVYEAVVSRRNGRSMDPSPIHHRPAQENGRGAHT